MKRKVLASLFAAAMMATSFVSAQDPVADMTDMQALRSAARSDKKALVASTLKLNDVEAKKFWPAYAAYQRNLDASNRRRNVAVEELIGRDQPWSDLHAKSFANELIASDEAELKARRSLHNRVIKVLPAKKAARYLQLENKIRAVQEYDIAATFPLVK